MVIDDIIVFSRTKEEYLTYPNEVLTLLENSENSLMAKNSLPGNCLLQIWLALDSMRCNSTWRQSQDEPIYHTVLQQEHTGLGR